MPEEHAELSHMQWDRCIFPAGGYLYECGAHLKDGARAYFWVLETPGTRVEWSMSSSDGGRDLVLEVRYASSVQEAQAAAQELRDTGLV